MPSSLIMTLSGIRGLPGENFNPDTALTAASSFGHILPKGSVVVGYDTRTTGPALKHAVISGLIATGHPVIDIGVVPTPTAQHAVLAHKAQGAIIITASHNDAPWNGLKFLNKHGQFISKPTFLELQSTIKNQSFTYNDWTQQGSYTDSSDAVKNHIMTIASHIPSAPIQESLLKVCIDPNNGAGCLASHQLLNYLQVTYTMLHCDHPGHFKHPPEPLEKNTTSLQHAVKEGDFDIGFVQDPDADRLALIDETGRYIGEDTSLAVCMDALLTIHPVKNPVIVVNLSTSKVIEHIAQKHQGTLHYSPVGEAHVIAKMHQTHATIGGEGNGGIIYPSISFGRDSLLGIYATLHWLASTQQPLSHLIKDYPKYFFIKDKIPLPTKEDFNSIIEVIKNKFSPFTFDTADGIKVQLPDGWFHLRPSNTESILRLYLEHPNSEKANEIHMLLRQLISETCSVQKD